MFRFLDVFQPLSHARLVESRLETGDACQDQHGNSLLYDWNTGSKKLKEILDEDTGLSDVCLSHP